MTSSSAHYQSGHVSRRTMLRAGSVTAAAAVGMSLLAACGKDSAGSSSSSDAVTFRLWDEQAAKAYQEALKDFTASTGVEVSVEVVPWADYWTNLRNDIAAGSAPDVFWTNSSNFVDYAKAGKLLNIDEAFPASEREGWAEGAVKQYTTDGTLWGVPALADPNIALYYNKALLDAAGVSVDELASLAWDPTAPSDSLREVATRLTLDTAGKTPADAGFDASSIAQYGYNAGLDLQAIYLPYLGAAGARYQDEDGQFAFASDEGVAAFTYVVDLINTAHVAPSAADTNDNGDFSRDQFIQGKMALFQSGAYNLANVKDGASFEWGVVPLPQGPAGRGGVSNYIVAAGAAEAGNAEGQKKLLAWLASAEGSGALGQSGVGLPGNTDAQETWKAYWQDQGVDVEAMMTIDDTALPGPFGAKISAGMDATTEILKEVFLGRVPVAEGVKQAQEAGNAALGA